MTNNKKRKSLINGKNVVLIILLFAVIAGFYMSASNEKDTKSNKKQDEYTILKEKDLTDSYPETPREVVKLYGRIAKCLYKEGMTDKQLETLVCQLRQLFDEELLRENPLETQLEALDYDLKRFHEDENVIINYKVEDKTLVKGEIDGREAATIVLSLSIKKGKDYTRTNEQFLLRQNYLGRWKIVGWQLADVEAESEGEKSA